MINPEKVIVTTSNEVWNQVLLLRHDYMGCLKLADETDSKKEDVFLKQEAKKALDQLRLICPHHHTVCLCSQYEGSYSMDYSDSHKEHRICLCCGVEEYTWDQDCKILTTVPFARFESNQPDQIKHPLKYLLSEATEIAESQGYHYYGHKVKY